MAIVRAGACIGLVAGLGSGLAACGGPILVGANADNGACPADAGADAALGPLVVPWSTGFENGLSDWDLCYIGPAGGVFPQVVTAPSPVHSGQHAAAFTVTTAPPAAMQSRCKKSGVLPRAAYYGAWYYLPAPAANTGNWNLLHFEGFDVPNSGCGLELWDVSLKNDAAGALSLTVHDFLNEQSFGTADEVPIGRWFHIEVYLQRATDNSGRFTLSRDGVVLVDQQGIMTDDSAWGEFHVGNLATSLSPATSTVYVDDVSIALTP